MPADSQANAISEMLTWLEQQLRLAREDQALANTQVQQLRQQVHTLAEDLNTANSIIREFEARLAGFRGIPEKVLGFDHDAEDLRQTFSRQRSELENALRLLRAEVEADRQERGESSRRMEAAQNLLSNLSTDVTQAQTQTAQANHTLQTILERQREAEARLQQFALRIDRTMEVARELEERIRANLLQEQEARLEVVFERLQVVGEMVRRNEELLNANRLEQTSRETALHELSVWREEHTRIDSRINHLEELTDKFTGQIDKLQSEIALLDGRHAGLGERVVGIRRDIAEIVDHIREEFAKYNQMMEKQRRKQIQVLEQELREMKFHAFHPPEEP